MDEDTLRQGLAEYLWEAADRPFGDVEGVSGRALQPFSFAGQQAAGNLLVKAWRALDAGDTGRAEVLTGRAAKLPFDDHEEAAPAAMVAHMMLFERVTDALEESERGDSRWLAAALQVLSGADPVAACDVRDVLVAIDQDYSLDQSEHRQLQKAVAQIPPRARLIDLRLEQTELATHVLSVLGACRDYERALETFAP